MPTFCVFLTKLLDIASILQDSLILEEKAGVNPSEILLSRQKAKSPDADFLKSADFLIQGQKALGPKIWTQC